MPETLQQSHATVDPGLATGNLTASHELRVRHRTFESAQGAEKRYSDSFIQGALDGELHVGGEAVGVKGYLDKVEATAADNEIIKDPEAIADLYKDTTAMLERNLKIMTVRSGDPNKDAARKAQVARAKRDFIDKLHGDADTTRQGIVDFCDGTSNRFPNQAMQYRGMEIDGKDPLDASGKNDSTLRSNIKIQRQGGGTFVMAYSDNRVREKVKGQDQPPAKRIYLNPDMAATPGIFEKVLTSANEAGLSVQLKMFQRAPELAEAHRMREKGMTKDGFRGDGIVIYTSEEDADTVLSMALGIAEENSEAFAGRKTSKMPQRIAEGVAVGDEPNAGGTESLTSHRTMILEDAAGFVGRSGKTGAEAYDLFRRRVNKTAKVNGVNPHNLAFNAAA